MDKAELKLMDVGKEDVIATSYKLIPVAGENTYNALYFYDIPDGINSDSDLQAAEIAERAKYANGESTDSAYLDLPLYYFFDSGKQDLGDEGTYYYYGLNKSNIGLHENDYKNGRGAISPGNDEMELFQKVATEDLHSYYVIKGDEKIYLYNLFTSAETKDMSFFNGNYDYVEDDDGYFFTFVGKNEKSV